MQQIVLGRVFAAIINSLLTLTHMAINIYLFVRLTIRFFGSHENRLIHAWKRPKMFVNIHLNQSTGVKVILVKLQWAQIIQKILR